MQATRFLPPLAFLASACAEPAWTPAATPASALEPDAGDLPWLRAYDLPPRAEVLRRWTLASDDPWAPYAKYTLMTSLKETPLRAALPDPEQLESVQRARAAAARFGASRLPAGTLWIVDLRGAASVAFGVALSSCPLAGAVSLVPTFNNWPARNEVVPAEETLAALATMFPSDAGEDGTASRPVFLLDAWRLAHRYDEPGDEAYDNRYALSPGDFPDAATLKSRGISQVVYVVDSLAHTTVEEDDLNPVLSLWSQAGIRIAMVDLDDAPCPPADGGWQQTFFVRDFLVAPRATVLGEPSFYLRARGGFGGVLARPSTSPGYGGWGGMRGGGG